VVSEKDKCETCRAKKLIEETKNLDIEVEKGMKDGERIIFRREGDHQVTVITLQKMVVVYS
jgi:DnaJ family protein A protein 2